MTPSASWSSSEPSRRAELEGYKWIIVRTPPAHGSLGNVSSRSVTGSSQHPNRVRSVNLPTFFSNPERCDAKEVAFGDDWRSLADSEANYRLYWLETTGECYLMRVPWTSKRFWGTRSGAINCAELLWLYHRRFDYDQPMTIQVLASGMSLSAAGSQLAGWEDAMCQPDGVSWVWQRLHPDVYYHRRRPAKAHGRRH